jgi:tetratricopeptide (TPR) repeat protein
VVLDAVALLWNPCNLDTLRERTGLESGTLSANLDRLQKAGWIQRLGERKKATYEVSERFFNVWYLMRRSSRRQGRDLRWLTDFLQGWFDKKEMRGILKDQMARMEELNQNEITYYLAMSRALGKNKTSKQATEQLYKRLIEIFDGDEEKVKECLGVKLEELDEAWFEEHQISKQQKLAIEAELKFDKAVNAHRKNELETAERIYFEALPNFSRKEIIWYNIGHLLHSLGKNLEAETAYKKALTFNRDKHIIYNSLGTLYRTSFNRYIEAKDFYNEAIKLDSSYAPPWNGLGNLYQDEFALYLNAEQFYKKAVELAPNNLYPKANLVFLYRDKLKDKQSAIELFESSKYQYAEQGLRDTQLLHESSFAAYNQNWGEAASYWKEALNEINEQLKFNTQDDWQRSAAVAVKLGYGKQLLELFEQTGHHRIFRPFYEAIKALTLSSEDYLRTQVAAEVREVALEMYAYMKKYNET